MAKDDSPSLLDPDGLARISRMELVARQAVEGFLTGRHPSPFHGSSVEYADHRPYTLGDEIRSIDWKLLAKTDKYYIKLFEEQTNLRCTIVLDASASMGFSSGQTMSKFQYGCHLAAALAYLMVRQNDSVGLAMFDDGVRQYLPSRSTASHFRNLIDIMEEAEPGGETSMATVLHELVGRLKRRGLIILISDLLDDPDAVSTALAHFKYRKHEVIVFHLMDEAELTFPYDRLTRFRDSEGSGMVVANPRVMRKRYLERLTEFLDQTKHRCLEQNISYELVHTNMPYDQMLSAYLQRRSRITRTARLA